MVDEDGDVFLRNQYAADGSVQLMVASLVEDGLILHELDQSPVADPVGGTWERVTVVGAADLADLCAALGISEDDDLVAHLAATFTSARS